MISNLEFGEAKTVRGIKTFPSSPSVAGGYMRRQFPWQPDLGSSHFYMCVCGNHSAVDNTLWTFFGRQRRGHMTKRACRIFQLSVRN